MALTPKERADFEEIVLRLRLEDSALGAVRVRRRPATPLAVGLVVGLVATAALGTGAVLLGQGLLGWALLGLVLAAGSAGAVWWLRSRSRRSPQR